MKILILILLAASLSGCSSLDRYDRTYSFSAEDKEGNKVGAGVTLHPRGFAK